VQSRHAGMTMPTDPDAEYGSGSRQILVLAAPNSALARAGLALPTSHGSEAAGDQSPPVADGARNH
jgi:hypothetical protein